MAEFKNRIRNLREEAGLTQKELGAKIKSSTSKISMWERGEREPVADDLAILSDLFHVTTDYLLGLSDIRNPYEIKTIAAHHDGEEYSKEEQKAIEEFMEMVRRLRGNKNE